MSKKTLDENLNTVLGIPDRAAFDALVELTPETVPHKDEMLEVMECIKPADLKAFIDAEHPTELAAAFQRLRTI